MEGILTTICDILHCTDIASVLSVITMLSWDQGTVSKLKEDLEAKKKENAKLWDEVKKLADMKNVSAYYLAEGD